MPGEKLLYSPGSELSKDEIDATFTKIVREELDPTYEGEVEIPFGEFVPSTNINEKIAAVATSTGYTGNNAEESA